MRRILHIVLVSIFLYGGLVSSAPLMFCQMDTCMEASVPDCCSPTAAVTDNCCAGSEDVYCPICSQNLCQSEPSPQAVSSTRIDRSDEIVIAGVAAGDLYIAPFTRAADICVNGEVRGGPPIWLEVRSLRL